MSERPSLESRIELEAASDGEARLVEADSGERAAIAAWLGLIALDYLKGSFTISRAQGGAIVRLELAAAAKRTCVVSLEPLTEDVRETIEIHFDKNFSEATEEDAEDEKTREPWPEGGLDLGALLIDYLALSLSPHPRKDGAASLVGTFGGQTLSSPFDQLRQLVDGKSKPAS